MEHVVRHVWRPAGQCTDASLSTTSVAVSDAAICADRHALWGGGTCGMHKVVAEIDCPHEVAAEIVASALSRVGTDSPDPKTGQPECIDYQPR